MTGSELALTDADPARLINKTISPGVRAKQSNMPFVQRENISHFVRACQMPPFSLPDHDIFLTDDLYEAKDPAQVLQCIVAFSRRANAVNPSAIARAIGARNQATFVSPQPSGTNLAKGLNPGNDHRRVVPVSNGSQPLGPLDLPRSGDHFSLEQS